ncbi:helix-turn-helix domain-containing protein [Novosphingobium sp. BL-52-GroH]|uniref:helix-turn-helix domain-containing protein n=1 Tax=Novosphingobium sp. BL-52-GroH TaxID=3349877 RepID=UPI00384ED8AF
MTSFSHVYDLPTTSGMDCAIRGRIALPGVVMELHEYRFEGPQGGVFSSPRSFLDLALSPRPGEPRGGYDEVDRGAVQALGPVIFVPAGARLHTHWGAGRQTSICCGFDGSGLASEEMGICTEVLRATLDIRSRPIVQALRRIAEEIARPGFCSEILAHAVWTQTAVELHRYLQLATRSHASGALRLSPAQLARIQDRVEQPGKPPKVCELAADCGLSARHFFRLFRATTGQTLTAYVADRKIALARRLLEPGGAAIKMVAWQCGFDSAAAFSAAFRKATGLTPRQFRQAMMH